MTDANTAEAILGMLTGSVAPNLSLAPATEDSDSWSGSSSSQQGAIHTMHMCFDACLDMATCYAAPVHLRATLGQLAELAYSKAPAVHRSSRASSLAPPQQLLSHSSKRRTNMSRMSVELMHTVQS